jgi:hypothetical protein
MAHFLLKVMRGIIPMGDVLTLGIGDLFPRRGGNREK